MVFNVKLSSFKTFTSFICILISPTENFLLRYVHATFNSLSNEKLEWCAKKKYPVSAQFLVSLISLSFKFLYLQISYRLYIFLTLVYWKIIIALNAVKLSNFCFYTISSYACQFPLSFLYLQISKLYLLKVHTCVMLLRRHPRVDTRASSETYD